MTVRTKVNYRKGVFEFLGSNIYLVIWRGLGGLKRSKGSRGSMSSRGWEFRKTGAPFPYFLFLVSYSLCVLAPLRALRETKNVWEVWEVSEV
jgi:hypothetical protein